MGLFDFLKKYDVAKVDAELVQLGANPDERKQVIDLVRRDDDNRIKKIIAAGNSGLTENYLLLKYAILFDPNINVKLAALKRLPAFKSNPDAIPMLTSLGESQDTAKLEPYFSMAMSKMGVITLDEFRNRINKA